MSYGAEAWTLTKKEKQAVLIFERKMFRRIYGHKYDNVEWHSRKNRELEEISKGEDIVKRIKGQRISRLVHLEKIDGGRMAKKIFTQKLEGFENKRKTQVKMESGSRKRSSSAGCEQMEKVGDG